MRVPDLGALGFAAVKDFLLCWLELIHFDSYDSGGAGLCYGTRGVRSGRERRGIDSDRFCAPAINSRGPCEALMSRSCVRGKCVEMRRFWCVCVFVWGCLDICVLISCVALRFLEFCDSCLPASKQFFSFWKKLTCLFVWILLMGRKPEGKNEWWKLKHRLTHGRICMLNLLILI